MENREELTKEDDLEILSKGDSISESENAENESRSEKIDAVVKNAASAIPQQPTSCGENGQVSHYFAKILTAELTIISVHFQVPEFDAAQVRTSSVFFQKTCRVFDVVF